MTTPFSVPSDLPADLARVLAYWRGLLRGNADMPFWDDVKLSDLPDLADRLFLIDVFARPDRFRFALVGKAISGGDLDGLFLDEVGPRPPLSFLTSQCSATVEAGAPTCFRGDAPPSAGGDGGAAYMRLLLPMWGDGRISMLLGAVDEA